MSALTCPDCDEPIFFTFMDTAGVGAWKRGDGFATVPDTSHYVCFPCGKAWKQRQDGPFTPDMIGDIAFFSCRNNDCGAPLTVTRHAAMPTDVELTCANGHEFGVQATDDGGLTLGPRRSQ